jgi:hypothetical protein
MHDDEDSVIDRNTKNRTKIRFAKGITATARLAA